MNCRLTARPLKVNKPNVYKSQCC